MKVYTIQQKNPIRAKKTISPNPLPTFPKENKEKYNTDIIGNTNNRIKSSRIPIK